MSRMACCALWLTAACSSGAYAMPAHGVPHDAACQVWQRELSFARSVEQHDMRAFAGHVATGAVFDANTAHPTRGIVAIRRHWATLIEGKRQRLRWYPRQVVVADDPALAYSSGPYLFENLAPAAKQRYSIGTFATVWRRGRNGAWQVLFDGGSDGQPASAADVAAFDAGRQQRCPPPTPAR
jgi:ketosteroid isomerase-like protein